MFFFLTYFALYNRLQFHPPHQNWFKCILFNSQIIFLCVYVPQLWKLFLLRPVFQIQNDKTISSVQSLSHVWLFEIPWTTACQASLSITNSQSLLKLMSIEPVMPPNHLIPCHPLLPSSIFPSIRVFSNESILHMRWPKYWSFSFSISLSNEYSGLISFWIDRLDLLAVQRTLKSLLQHHSSKASVLLCSAFLAETYECGAVCILFNQLSQPSLTFTTLSSE